ncbi:MAG TPA: DUF4402 domain-containing protein [Sphingomicrobium sp.]
MMARTAVVLALCAAGFAVAAPAGAQCRLCGKPSSIPDASASSDRIELNVEAGLDFDRLVVVDSGDGSAVLRPDGTSQVQGSVQSISGRAMVGEAHVHGEPGRSIRVDMPGRVDLRSMGGASIRIDEIVTDLPPFPKLDSSGNLSFRFGGRIRVSGNADGDFRGELPITVEYL